MGEEEEDIEGGKAEDRGRRLRTIRRMREKKTVERRMRSARIRPNCRLSSTRADSR